MHIGASNCLLIFFLHATLLSLDLKVETVIRYPDSNIRTAAGRFKNALTESRERRCRNFIIPCLKTSRKILI